ncbi:MAG: hypothetical protein LBM00_10765 [Deltaproteobacteria bacterium]|jgi:hypothetical protein|nr:hypothetical protein [Deltaproteobacteria bacterium]
MKVFTFVLLGVILPTLFSGCTSAPKNELPAVEGTAPPQPPVVISYAITDHQGARAGRPIPGWITAVMDGDTGPLYIMEKFKGRKIFVTSASGVDRDLTRRLAESKISAEFASTMTQDIQSSLLTSVKGDVNKGGEVSIDDITAVSSIVSTSGLSKDMDYWVQTTDRGTGKREYTYYMVYSMDEFQFQAQLEAALRRLEGKNAVLGKQ